MTSEAARSKAERLNKLGQKKMNQMARQGEADRHTTAALPKHLVSPFSPSDFSGLLCRFSNARVVFRKAWYGQDATEVVVCCSMMSWCWENPTLCRSALYAVVADWLYEQLDEKRS